MATETVNADAGPTNPTPARIKAARLLKQLNADDQLPTTPDVEALAALNPDEYRVARRRRHDRSTWTDSVLASTLATQLVKSRLLSDMVDRVGYFGPHADSRSLALIGDAGIWHLVDSHCSWSSEADRDEEPLPITSPRRARSA